MKRVTVQLNQIIGAVLLTVSFWACNDFLDEQPSKSTRLPITHTEQLDALLANYTDFAKNPTGRLSVVTTIGNSGRVVSGTTDVLPRTGCYPANLPWRL
ncbi:MAG: hypothetical protein ACLR5I_16050 [Odoribacter splanchnicus]